MVLGKLFSGLGSAASGAAAGSALGPFGALAGGVIGLGSSLAGSSSGGGSAGNMGGMAKVAIPEPVSSRYITDPTKFLKAFQDGVFGSKNSAWAEGEINRMLSPSQRSALLGENEDYQNIVGFQFDDGKRRELASMFSDAAFGGKSATRNFVDDIAAQTKALGINDERGIQRYAQEAAAFDPRAPKIASKQQRDMEARYGQFNPENSKYLVGNVQGLIDDRIRGVA
jgi:hypothetical protein